MFFDFGGGITLDDTDITTTSGTLVEITDTPGGRSLVFTGNGIGGAFPSSLEFGNFPTFPFLAFGQTGNEGLYFNGISDGNYEAVAIPFGVSESLGLVGLATLVGVRQAKKYYANKQQASEA